MNTSLALLFLGGLSALPAAALAQTAPAEPPYRVLQAIKVGGSGGFDYVYADPDDRRLYTPRGDRIPVYDLDTFSQVGEIPGTNKVHGVAVDPKTFHGFSSSNPVVMWDARTLVPIKTIDVAGSPDGILFEPATECVYVLSHRPPNVTVIDARDGSVVGTIDLGGAPEQAVSDGQGRVWIDLEDQDQIAVVDARTRQVTAHYGLGGLGGGPGGLALDAKNRILFATCHDPQTCVILDADSGKILTSLPIGKGTDGATFNPATLEAFSSQGDGTLTVIKEDSPDSFAVEQTVATRPWAKTLTLDPLTGHLLLITAEFGPPPLPAAGGSAPVPRRPRRGPMVPDSFTILVVGR